MPKQDPFYRGVYAYGGGTTTVTPGVTPGQAAGTLELIDGKLYATLTSLSGPATGAEIIVSMAAVGATYQQILAGVLGVRQEIYGADMLTLANLPAQYTFAPIGGVFGPWSQLVADPFLVTVPPTINLGTAPQIGGTGLVTPPVSNAEAVASVLFRVRPAGTENAQDAGDYSSWGVASADINLPQTVTTPAGAANTTAFVVFRMLYLGNIYEVESDTTALITPLVPPAVLPRNIRFDDSVLDPVITNMYRPEWALLDLGDVDAVEWSVALDPTREELWHPALALPTVGTYTTAVRPDWGNNEPQNPDLFEAGTERADRGILIRYRLTPTGPWSTLSQRFFFQPPPPPPLSAPEPPLGVGDYIAVRSVWRPAGQTVTFAPIITFPPFTQAQLDDLAVNFRASKFGLDAPWYPLVRVTGSATEWTTSDTDAPNQGVFTVGAPETKQFRVQHKFLSKNQEMSAAAPHLTSLPTPTTTEPPVVVSGYTPTVAAMDKIAQRPPLTYDVPFDVGDASTERNGLDDKTTAIVHPVMYALAAYANDPRVFTTQSDAKTESHGTYRFAANTTAADRLLYQLKVWANDFQTAPRCSAGYSGQFETPFTAAVLIARKIPAVWNALTASERTRLSLVIEGQGYAGAWTHSAAHPHGGGFGFQGNGGNRSVRGYSSGWLPGGWNICGPGNLFPIMAAIFFSEGKSEAIGTTFQNMLTNFDRDEFAGRIAAAQGATEALKDLYNTYRRTWTLTVQNEEHRNVSGNGGGWPVGPGPTKDELYKALNNGFTKAQVDAKKLDGTVAETYWRNGSNLTGFDKAIKVTEPRRMAQSQIKAFFRNTIAPGYPNPLPGGVTLGESGPGVSGIYGMRISSTKLTACFVNKNDWAKISNRGQTGAGDEMKQSDAGNSVASLPNIRSSVSYSQQSFVALINFLAVAAVYKLPQETPAVAYDDDLLQRGVTFFKECDLYGYNSHAKDGQTNSEVWGASYVSSYDVIARYDVARIFIAEA